MAIENTVTFCKNATNLVEILILDNLYRSRLRFLPIYLPKIRPQIRQRGFARQIDMVLGQTR